MSESLEQSPVYRIALSMSGAISAGAYTAGVYDFFIMALAELDAARRDPNHPDHDKVPRTHVPRIVAMTGASAGGITAAVGAVSLGYGLRFQHDPAIPGGRGPVALRPQVGPDPVFGVMPNLYRAWVTMPRMVAEDGGEALLTTTDLPNCKAVPHSLLNTRVLDQIRDLSLTPPDDAPIVQNAPYSFCYETLHLYLTITNIAGIQYDVKGKQAEIPYHMVTHADRVHFKIAGMGHVPHSPDGWAEVDKGDRTSVRDLRDSTGQDWVWRKVGHSALATSAFPAGLAARELCSDRDGFLDRWFPAPNFDGADIRPVFDPTYPDPFAWANMDGGVINNDPFDFARYALLDDWRNNASNPRDPRDADRAVVMISPFPEGKTTGKFQSPNLALNAVLSALLPTLLTQVRFKVDELAAAADETIASRWLIAPRRYNDDTEIPSSRYIACGALGGFGGFLDQKFREHDYLLGRRNCQWFLANWTASKHTYESGKPIVPLVGSAAIPVPQPHWPKMSGYDLERLIVHVRQRGDAVIPAVLRQVLPGCVACLLSWPAKILWRLLGVPKVREAIETDLIDRQQL